MLATHYYHPNQNVIVNLIVTRAASVVLCCCARHTWRFQLLVFFLQKFPFISFFEQIFQRIWKREKNEPGWFYVFIIVLIGLTCLMQNWQLDQRQRVQKRTKAQFNIEQKFTKNIHNTQHNFYKWSALPCFANPT